MVIDFVVDEWFGNAHERSRVEIRPLELASRWSHCIQSHHREVTLILGHPGPCLLNEAFLDMLQQRCFSNTSRTKNEDQQRACWLADRAPHGSICLAQVRMCHGIRFKVSEAGLFGLL